MLGDLEGVETSDLAIDPVFVQGVLGKEPLKDFFGEKLTQVDVQRRFIFLGFSWALRAGNVSRPTTNYKRTMCVFDLTREGSHSKFYRTIGDREP